MRPELQLPADRTVPAPASRCTSSPPSPGVIQDPGVIAARMRAEGLSPHGWGNGPGDTYGWHEHGYEKVLYCVRGRIVFHTPGGD